jgi:succinate dehydrogenase / fumarate reductase cytochrome b subunit
MAERPLSPFITVYRWSYTMTLSILHRITGVALALALLGLVAWLLSASRGADAYATFTPLLLSIPGKLLVVLAMAALIYHCCNGLRHLAWDMGWGFERVEARRSAALVVIVTLIAAALCLYALFRSGTGGA